MYGNQNTTFSTCEYRIFPTREQKLQLTARFDQEDAAYNMLANTVNDAFSRGADNKTLKQLVQERHIPAFDEVDFFVVNQVRKRITSLLPRLCSLHQAAACGSQPAQCMLPLCRRQRLPSGPADHWLDRNGAAP